MCHSRSCLAASTRLGTALSHLVATLTAIAWRLSRWPIPQE